MWVQYPPNEETIKYSEHTVMQASKEHGITIPRTCGQGLLRSIYSSGELLNRCSMSTELKRVSANPLPTPKIDNLPQEGT